MCSYFPFLLLICFCFRKFIFHLGGKENPQKLNSKSCIIICRLLSFFQLAQDEGSPVRGFGVVEYESAEQAEAVLIEMDRTLVGGQEVRLSLCTPGTSGRSTLAALIAAQGMVSITLTRATLFSTIKLLHMRATNDLD